jgi:Amiloride-sensitive sodium channel
MTSQRTELYGLIDFLANCGGILGLCLGVSVISILEILFFCTIRLCRKIQEGSRTNHSTTIIVDEIECRRDKSRRVVKTLKELVGSYSSRTTIQGIKFCADSGLSLIERFWWATVIAMSILCCASLIAGIIRRYEQTPMIISYANEETSISEVNS